MKLCISSLRSSLLYTLLFVALVSGQSKTTIHIQHPWADDSVRSTYAPYVISSETGWYPGTPMNAEGGNWYTYTFTKLNRLTNDRVEFASYIPDGYNKYGNAVRYPAAQQLIFLKLFEGSDAGENEIWIIPSSTGGTPRILFTPPGGGKVISFLNPWELGAPRIMVSGFGAITMRQEIREGRCGWFVYHYYGPPDSLCTLFMNSLDSTLFGLTPAAPGSCIDLKTVLATSDSVWVYRGLADTVTKTSAVYPGINGECSKTIYLAALMRDIGLHPDFGIYDELAADSCGGLQTGMVEKRLGADGKPVKKVHRCKNIHSRFDWFETQTFDNGYTNETCYNLALTKNEEGLYSYDTNSFFPLDSFIYLDDAGTLPNPNNNLFIDPNNRPPANIHFTMELSAQFDYHKGQTFYFRGDDDVWVYIDSQLVVDLGGNHGPVEGAVDLDTLGLFPDVTYSFKLFFTERNCCGSNFLMQTSLNLRTSSRLFPKLSIPAPGQLQYDFFERVSRSSLACNASESEVDTIDAAAQFFIDGPQFTERKLLSSGLSYGGIYIAAKNNVITLDSSAVSGLAPGLYTITINMASDPTQTMKITFTVIQPPKPVIVKNPVVSAAYFSDNGIGQVDRVEMYYTNALTKLPDSILLFWPEPILESKRSASGASSIIPDPLNAAHLTVKLALPFDSIITKNRGTTQLGTSYLFDTSFVNPADISRFSIDDSVGPLITSAWMPEHNDSGFDTFYLTFSEPVPNGGIAGVSFLIAHADGTETAVKVTGTRQWFDTLVVITQEVSPLPITNDRIRIAPEGPVTDAYGNHAHQLNRSVPLKIRMAAPKIEQSYYTDENGDGVIDHIIFKFDRSAKSCSCFFEVVRNGVSLSASVPVTALSYRQNDSSIITLDLAAAVETPLLPGTSGMLYYKLSVTGDAVSEQTGISADSAAPVVLAAEYQPAAFTDNANSIVDDTMVVTFSEEVTSDFGIHPLIISKRGAMAVSVPELRVLQKTGTTVVYLVASTFTDELYPSDNDSVYINTAAFVADSVNNRQTNPLNNRALLLVKEIRPHFKIKYGPNPFNPLTETFAILVDPYVRSKGSTQFTVTVSIYDKTGTRIHHVPWPAGKIPATVAEKVVWNGTNRNGRYVGNGTYLAIVKVFDSSGSRIPVDMQGPLFIGVMKP